MESINKEQTFQLSKTVYGPVNSWRFGQSLGIDPLFHTSTCSFNCIYCQLGHIQNITTQIKDYVATEKVLQDYREIREGLPLEQPIDIIMYSGSGEPTLARNLGDIARGIKSHDPHIPQAVLTNAVHLGLAQVQESLQSIDKVILKLDAPQEKIFQAINRPAPGVTLTKVLNGIQSFKRNYSGEIEVQIMLMPINQNTISDWCDYLKKINPQKIQINSPKRAYPLQWHRENRGNHHGIHDHETRVLKVLPKEEKAKIAKIIYKQTGIETLVA